MVGTIFAVLALLLLASVVLGNLFASRRRAQLRAGRSVYAEVRRGLAAAPRNGHKGSPIGALAEVPDDAELETDLYEHLSELVDPAEFRPKLADDIEVKVFRLKWGNDYVMVAN